MTSVARVAPAHNAVCRVMTVLLVLLVETSVSTPPNPRFSTRVGALHELIMALPRKNNCKTDIGHGAAPPAILWWSLWPVVPYGFQLLYHRRDMTSDNALPAAATYHRLRLGYPVDEASTVRKFFLDGAAAWVQSALRGGGPRAQYTGSHSSTMGAIHTAGHSIEAHLSHEDDSQLLPSR